MDHRHQETAEISAFMPLRTRALPTHHACRMLASRTISTSMASLLTSAITPSSSTLRTCRVFEPSPSPLKEVALVLWANGASRHGVTYAAMVEHAPPRESSRRCQHSFDEECMSHLDGDLLDSDRQHSGRQHSDRQHWENLGYGTQSPAGMGSGEDDGVGMAKRLLKELVKCWCAIQVTLISPSPLIYREFDEERTKHLACSCRTAMLPHCALFCCQPAGPAPMLPCICSPEGRGCGGRGG